jgi:hypothetical protein
MSPKNRSSGHDLWTTALIRRSGSIYVHHGGVTPSFRLQPKIPALLIRCVIALEKRHLNSVGLYRVQGNEREVKALLEAFNSPYGPNLNNRDPETIASCIKKFLIGLRV